MTARKEISQKIEEELNKIGNPLVKRALEFRKDSFMFSGIFGKRDYIKTKPVHKDSMDGSFIEHELYYFEGDCEYPIDHPSDVGKAYDDEARYGDQGDRPVYKDSNHTDGWW